MFTLPTHLYNSIITAGEDPALWPPLGGWGAAISFGDPFADNQFQDLEITSFTDTSINESQNLMSTPVQATSLDITSVPGNITSNTSQVVLKTALSSVGIVLNSETGSALQTDSFTSNAFIVANTNNSLATATSMVSSSLATDSDAKNQLEVESDKAVQLSVNSDKATTTTTSTQSTKATNN